MVISPGRKATFVNWDFVFMTLLRIESSGIAQAVKAGGAVGGLGVEEFEPAGGVRLAVCVVQPIDQVCGYLNHATGSRWDVAA